MPAPILPELLDLFPDSVTIEEPTGFTTRGVPLGYGAVRTYRARVLGNIQKVMAPDGTEKVSKLTVLIGGTPGVSIYARVTLPARFVPRQPKVISAHVGTDENGVHHERVYF